jgi:hypothetical protein
MNSHENQIWTGAGGHPLTFTHPDHGVAVGVGVQLLGCSSLVLRRQSLKKFLRNNCRNSSGADPTGDMNPREFRESL